MQNKLYAGFIFLVFTITANFSFAQFYGGAHVNYSRYLQGSKINSIGLGIHGESGMGDGSASMRFGINIGTPSKIDYIYRLEPLNSGYEYREVVGKQQYTFMSLFVEYKRYFFDGYLEEGGFYACAGAGITMVTIGHQVGAFDQTNYTLGFDPTQKDKLFQPTFKIGPGYDFSLGFASIFAEAFVNIPVNTIGISTFSVEIPASVGVQAGIKFPIGS